MVRAQRTPGATAFAGLERDYEAARPDYPPEALEGLRDRTGEPAPPRILDVGCGTGKFTRQLAALYPGCAVEGCDADAGMVEEARRATGPGPAFRVASAEALPAAEGSSGLVTAAQAAHWFDRPRFLAEVLRALAPGGTVALIENNRDWRASRFLDAYEGLLEDGSPGYSRHYREHDLAGELAAAGFRDVARMEVPWRRLVPRATFVRMARSSTKVQAALRAAGEREVLGRLDALLDEHAAEGGRIEVPYVTVLVHGRAPPG